VPTFIFLIVGMHCSTNGEHSSHLRPRKPWCLTIPDRLLPPPVPGRSAPDPMPLPLGRLFITSLNLMPIGQLDGARPLRLLPKKANRIAPRCALRRLHGRVEHHKLWMWIPMILLVYFVLGTSIADADDKEPLGSCETCSAATSPSSSSASRHAVSSSVVRYDTTRRLARQHSPCRCGQHQFMPGQIIKSCRDCVQVVNLDPCRDACQS